MSTIAQNTTAEDLFDNHPAQRCELVRGEIRMMSPAGGMHGWIVVNATRLLANFVSENNLGYVLGAETGYIIRRDPDTVRAPDVSFIRAERVTGELTEKFFPGAPDLAVEVLSPGDTATEVDQKSEEWLKAGCVEVWLIDPQRKSVSKCTLDGSAVIRESVEVLSNSDLLPGFELDASSLFN